MHTALILLIPLRAQVLARDGLMGGLVSEKYLGVAAPSTTGPEDPDLDEVGCCR